MSKTHKIGGVEYPLAWGNLALFRFRSIPAEHRNVAGPAQMAQFIWSAYKGTVHPFPTYEHVLAACADMQEADYIAVCESVVSLLPAPAAQDHADAPAAAKEPSDGEKKSSSSKSEPSPAAA